jgi:hypothetical protein
MSFIGHLFLRFRCCARVAAAANMERMRNTDGDGSADMPLESAGPIPGTEPREQVSDQAALRSLLWPRTPGEPREPAQESWWDRAWSTHSLQTALGVFICGPVLELLQPGRGTLQATCVAWGAFQPLIAFNVIHRVGRRRPPGDMRKAGAAVVCSVGPWLLFLPFWDALTAPGPLLAFFTFLIVWGASLRLVARDSWRPRWRPWFWTALSYLAALTCIGGVGAGFWLVVMFWPFVPDPPQTILGLLVLLTALGLALIPLCGWAAATFLAGAHWRPRPTADS